MSNQYYQHSAPSQYYPQQQYSSVQTTQQPLTQSTQYTQTYKPQMQAQVQQVPQRQPQSFKDYLRSLPMFPLSTEHEAKAKQEMLKTSADLYNMQQPEPKLSGVDKVTLGLMDVTTGGVMNMRKFENNALKLTAGLSATTAADINTVVLTRWAYVPDESGRDTRGLVMVDVLQCRSSVPWAFKNNPAYLKAGSAAGENVSLTVFGKDVKVKGDKMWSKKLTTKTVDQLSLIQGDGTRVAMEPIMTGQLNTSAIEWGQTCRRFENGWKVPRL